MSRHRLRALAFCALALGLGALALTTGGEHGAVAPQPLRQVIELRRPVDAGQRIVAADLSTMEIPVPWADSHQLTDPDFAIGRRVAVALPAGSPLMDAELVSDATPTATRDITLRLDDAAGLPLNPPDGMTADLYLVESGRPPQVTLVLRGAMVVSSSRNDGETTATLRVAPSDVSELIESEARGSLRLVVRNGD